MASDIPSRKPKSNDCWRVVTYDKAIWLKVRGFSSEDLAITTLYSEIAIAWSIATNPITIMTLLTRKNKASLETGLEIVSRKMHASKTYSTSKCFPRCRPNLVPSPITQVPRFSDRASTIHRYAVGSQTEIRIGFAGIESRKLPHRNLL